MISISRPRSPIGWCFSTRGRSAPRGRLDEVMTAENLRVVLGLELEVGSGGGGRSVRPPARAKPGVVHDLPRILDQSGGAVYKRDRSMPSIFALILRASARAFLVTLASVALLGLGACVSTDIPPQLLNVLDFAPREAEVGDRLEVIGSGFPEGKTGHVAFKGTLNRPGQKPIKGVEIEVEAASSRPTRSR